MMTRMLGLPWAATGLAMQARIIRVPANAVVIVLLLRFILYLLRLKQLLLSRLSLVDLVSDP
jgi:hypothetical protein